MRRIAAYAVPLGLAASIACGGSSSSGNTSSTPSSSEVAASSVSGAINNSAGSTFGWNVPRAPTAPLFQRMIDELNPIAKAYAATWSCTGGSLAKTGGGTGFTGPGSYTFTPLSCSVTWANNKTASSDWSGTFNLAYGTSCDITHARIINQAASCTLTRTTATGGNTRTVTGPNGNAYAITHDTNGAGTGWDTALSPAPTNAGVVATCNAGGCTTGGGTLAINGSHLSGTVTPSGGTSTKIWDHTVSTDSGPLTFTESGTSLTLSGAVTVQHNLAKYTAISTFNSVVFTAGCCFPTSGSITTTFQNGPFKGDTETLTFSSQCGETTLKDTSGNTGSLTLQHCL
jgi:hypothetical protein